MKLLKFTPITRYETYGFTESERYNDGSDPRYESIEYEIALG